MIYFLYESSLGYSLFKMNKADKLSMQDPKIIAQISNFSDFKKIASLEGTHFFHGHNVAFESIDTLKQGKIPENLLNFLKENLPAQKKKALKLAIQDKSIAGELTKALKIKCVSGENYQEVFRGIREHLEKFLTGREEENIDSGKITMANLGLGHALARDNIKFDKRKQDKSIINAFALLDMIEKNLNTFSMRIKEGYGWHFPELSKLVGDNETYVKMVRLIGDKQNISEIDFDELVEAVGDENVANKIIERAKSSMGNELEEVDGQTLREFCDFTLGHFEFRRELQEYLREEMTQVAPNLTAILGETLGARLISHAGGLGSLSKLPSSTIQILGAEKALFRAIKKKSSTPKYGLLFNSSYISRAKTSAKGQISRMLANKCALASRLDQFLLKPTDQFGLHFRKQLDEKIAKPDKADLGKRNIEQMEQLVDELIESGEYLKIKNNQFQKIIN